jgi:multiple sugar transport system substrate-binding protein
VAAGSGAPDAAIVDYVYISELGAGGGFENLLKTPYNAGEFKKDFPAFKWAQGSTGPGELIGFPTDMAPGCAFLYQPTWDEKRIRYSSIKTLDDLLAAGKKLTFNSKGGSTPDHWLISHAYLIFKMIFFSDKQRYFDKSGQPALTTPRIKLALKWAKKFRDAGVDANINDWSNDWFAMLGAGTAAFIPGGAWLTEDLKDQWAPDQKGKYRVGMLPALEKGGKPMMMSDGGSFFVIPSQVPDVNKAAAWEFIKFLCTRVKSQLISLNTSYSFPDYMPAWQDPSMSEGVDYLGGQKAKLIWIDVAKSIPEVYVNPKDSLAAGILASAAYDYIDGKKELDNALNDAQKELTTKMNQ